MNLMILAASLCVKESSVQRPTMSQVLLLLRGSCGGITLIRKSGELSSWKTYFKEHFRAEEHSLTRGSSYATCQKHIALKV
ncbi:receptor-like cytosolic serine threonine- kinase RBK2 isoform X1 [Olea europaea subsp. europaea]|nr:receptor-like cytosolic serine threonine- kinase RBK2 isoform X1 [Olea europaea subsp. europaea]